MDIAKGAAMVVGASKISVRSECMVGNVVSSYEKPTVEPHEKSPYEKFGIEHPLRKEAKPIIDKVYARVHVKEPSERSLHEATALVLAKGHQVDVSRLAYTGKYDAFHHTCEASPNHL